MAAAWGMAAAAQAALGATAAGGCGKGVGGLLDDIPSFTVDCPGGFWADARPGALSTASWSASAAPGVLRASASVVVDTMPVLGSTLPLALGVGATASGRYIDDLVFNVPGFAGARGKMQFSVRVGGQLEAEHVSPHAGASASWQLTATTDNTVNGRLRSLGSAAQGSKLENFYDWGKTGTPLVKGVYLYELPVIFGEPINFVLALNVRANASGWRGGPANEPAYMTPVQSEAAASFGNTALWQGIGALTLADGTAVQAWTVSAASGFNYAQPVPEPAAWVLLVAGLGGVGWVARRRRQG